MKNRTPAVPNAGQPIAFAPVPRKHRHDGWTPERQRAFIEALADTGSVRRAAAMVNMSSEGAYYLRRQPGSEGFAAAWSAALDHGVQRMKDVAFERAIEGELIPILAGGKLIGYRRRFNDRLLMFCLRHYGQDAVGKRTTINYFSTRATAASADGEAAAEASTTTVRTTIAGPPDDGASSAAASAILASFEGVELDSTAHAEIARVLDQCAARRRAGAGGAADPDELFFAAEQPERDMLVYHEGYSRPTKVRARPPAASGNIVPADAFLEHSIRPDVDEQDQYRSGEGEVGWEMLDDIESLDAVDRAVASIKASQSEPDPPSTGE